MGEGKVEKAPADLLARDGVNHMRLSSKQTAPGAVKVNFSDGKYSRAGGICQSGWVCEKYVDEFSKKSL